MVEVHPTRVTTAHPRPRHCSRHRVRARGLPCPPGPIRGRSIVRRSRSALAVATGCAAMALALPSQGAADVTGTLSSRRISRRPRGPGPGGGSPPASWTTPSSATEGRRCRGTSATRAFGSPTSSPAAGSVTKPRPPLSWTAPARTCGAGRFRGRRAQVTVRRGTALRVVQPGAGPATRAQCGDLAGQRRRRPHGLRAHHRRIGRPEGRVDGYTPAPLCPSGSSSALSPKGCHGRCRICW